VNPKQDQSDRSGRPHPQESRAQDEAALWRTVHCATAGSPALTAARVRMQTSDGTFRITARSLQGRIGLMIERLVEAEPERDAKSDAAEDASDVAEIPATAA